MKPEETNNIFVIDIETGICGRLKFTTNFLEPFIVENDKLLLEDEEGNISLSLDKIFKKLTVQER